MAVPESNPIYTSPEMSEPYDFDSSYPSICEAPCTACNLAELVVSGVEMPIHSSWVTWVAWATRMMPARGVYGTAEPQLFLG